MCGMGRIGSVFACEQFNVEPDIITIAKGLGAGYQPIGAMMCSTQIYEAIQDGSGFFQHGHTYMGHSLAARAALAVLETFEEKNLMPRVRALGEQLENKLKAEFSQHQHIGDIRGQGLFWGLEIVKNKETKEPFDPKLGINKKIKTAAFEAGLICYPMGGTIDGRKGDHVLLAPPFIMDDHHVDELVQKLAQAFSSVLDG
ncbi:UNVERIFIED_CONTAM: hypothetical protein GTU68_029880 [Idotea baltica]|nr:hypothetical protein [Idotea baltica]